MTELELTDVLLTVLTGTVGRDPDHWRRVLGPMHRYPISTHPQWNWRFTPSGSAGDVLTAEKAIDVVRAAHPLVSMG